jgi:hypothetical protein
MKVRSKMTRGCKDWVSLCVAYNVSELKGLAELANAVNTQTAGNTAVRSKYPGICVPNTLLRCTAHVNLI